MNSQIISERLKVLGNPTLKYRRYRGDMIEMYKILHGINDTAVSPDLPICQDSVTRGITANKLRTSRDMICKSTFSLKG